VDVYNVEPAPKEPVAGASRLAWKVLSMASDSPFVAFFGDAFNPSVLSTITLGVQMPPACFEQPWGAHRLGVRAKQFTSWWTMQHRDPLRRHLCGSSSSIDLDPGTGCYSTASFQQQAAEPDLGCCQHSPLTQGLSGLEVGYGDIIYSSSGSSSSQVQSRMWVQCAGQGCPS